MDEQRSEVDKALKSLEELAKHNKLLNPAPIAGYRNKHNRRWEAVCQQVCSVYVTKVCVYEISLSLSPPPSSLSLTLSPHLCSPSLLGGKQERALW